MLLSVHYFLTFQPLAKMLKIPSVLTMYCFKTLFTIKYAPCAIARYSPAITAVNDYYKAKIGL